MVAKPAPLIVHPAKDLGEVSLLGVLKARWPEEEFHFVNRLDRETSGCVLVARSRGAARVFGKKMMRRQIEKQYHAIVHGWPEWHEITVDQPILRKGEVEESEVWVRQMVHDSGKPSVTIFKVENKFLREGKRYSVIECHPETGRTHQLRVHLEYLGHPIAGDKIYGGTGGEYLEFLQSGWTEELARELILSRQALHGHAISFEWEGVKVDISCPWPDELEKFSLGSPVVKG